MSGRGNSPAGDSRSRNSPTFCPITSEARNACTSSCKVILVSFWPEFEWCDRYWLNFMKIRQAFLESLQVFNPTDRQSDFWALHRVRTRQRINKNFFSIKITCHLNTRVCTIPELSYMSNITQIMGRAEWMFCVGTQMLCSEYRLYSLGKENLYSVICASYKKRYPTKISSSWYYWLSIFF